MSTHLASYANWLSDRGNTPESMNLRTLTVAEQQAFDNCYRANQRAALSLARLTAGAGKRQALDIVHGAIARMTYDVIRDKSPVPRTAPAFRSWFLAYVQNVAQKVGAAPKPLSPKLNGESQQQKYWGEELAPISGRKVPERELRADMMLHAYEQPKPANVGAPAVAPKRTATCETYGPCWPKPNRVELAEDLDFIIQTARRMLSYQQSLVIECLLDAPRDIVRRVLELSPKTVDTHASRAYAKLRKILVGFVWIVPNGYGRPAGGTHWSEWNAIFASMEARRQRREAMATKRGRAA